MASVDTPEKNKAFAKQEQANFPMLSDPAKQDGDGLRRPQPDGHAPSGGRSTSAPDGNDHVHRQDGEAAGPGALQQHVRNDCGPGPKLAAKLAELKVKKKM